MKDSGSRQKKRIQGIDAPPRICYNNPNENLLCLRVSGFIVSPFR